MKAFEDLLEVNPGLQQELQFQMDVIKGIGEYRKAQLLANLEAVNIGPAWLTFIQHNPIAQYIGGAIALSLIGGSVYFFADTEQVSQVSQESTGVATVEPPLVEMVDFDLPEGLVIEAPEELHNHETSMVEEQPVVSAEAATNRVVGFTPSVHVPSVEDVEADPDFVPDDLPATDIAEKPVNEPIDVELVDTRSNRIRYRYYAGKLYLYGNFEQDPYEILEINSAEGRTVYLYHQESFYKIESSNEILPLEAIRDQRLIQELIILQKAK